MAAATAPINAATLPRAPTRAAARTRIPQHSTAAHARRLAELDASRSSARSIAMALGGRRRAAWMWRSAERESDHLARRRPGDRPRRGAPATSPPPPPEIDTPPERAPAGARRGRSAHRQRARPLGSSEPLRSIDAARSARGASGRGFSSRLVWNLVARTRWCTTSAGAPEAIADGLLRWRAPAGRHSAAASGAHVRTSAGGMRGATSSERLAAHPQARWRRPGERHRPCSAIAHRDALAAGARMPRRTTRATRSKAELEAAGGSVDGASTDGGLFGDTP